MNLKDAVRCAGWMAILSVAWQMCCMAQSTTPHTQPRMRVSMRPGLPFIATSVTTLQRKLADGTVVKATSEDIVARDNAGRWYSDEHPVAGQPESKNIPYHPDVRDPLAHVYVHFVPSARKVLIYPMPTVEASPKHLPVRTQQLPGGASVKTEELPEQTILGFRAWGRRRTETVQYGGKPIVILDEFWYCDELGMDLLRRHVDPRVGEEVTAIIQVDRVEPDAALFRIPEGWTQEEIGVQ